MVQTHPVKYGYTGRILRVNLSTGETWVEEPPPQFYRTYMGGWGVIAYFLLKELPPNVDPLEPGNLLVFAPGVITGAPIISSGRSAVGARSPLTGAFGAAEAGGWWGAELKAAGFDAIVIQGRANCPVYLWIKDGVAQIRPANHLWGMLTAETQAALRQELGDPRVRVAQIGPAGERLSRIAAVMHDVNRAAGRCGLGAVMGSKMLKAVAVRGSGKVEVADSAGLHSIGRRITQRFPDTWVPDLRDRGTADIVPTQQLTGGLPTRNFGYGTFEGWEQITGERMRDTILVDRDGCFACPIRCKRVVEVKEGAYRVRPVYGGPEYETVAALGSNCGVSELAAVAKGNELCNAYGLDTISCGATIAWAMECFERGLLALDDTGGLELRFGDASTMVRLVEQIGRREGFGRLLGEGSYRAAKATGRGTEVLVMHSKGQEIPMHDPRVKYALGLGYAVSPTGADHNHNMHDTEYTSEGGVAPARCLGVLSPLPFDDLGPAKVRLASIEIPWSMVVNTLGLCAFAALLFGRPGVVEVVRAVTGWDTSLHELLKAGERAYTMARAFNARQGFTAADDGIPARFFERPRGEPPVGNALSADEFEQARILFYQMMGWDGRSGAPAAWKLHELGVGWVAES